ncbi:hypothetical protein FRC04_005865 [Tulasnella sp. 424]|nr:hypothetical protein FRC04_005865 [Tulasnella sp. 424]KAG8976009.1 hypothetical protein FRC05_004640 [Tulasnella sp. 425]
MTAQEKFPPHNVFSSERTALKIGGTALLALTFQSLGIIYSDIGTSPLYVLNGIWPASGPAPPKEDVIGGISAIIWSLTLIPLLKYIFIVLQFGTKEGEGGTFALFQGLFPPDVHNDDDDRALTGDSAFLRAHSTRSSSEKLAPIKWPLLAWTLFGTSLSIADGILTPAVSVTSAVGGIAIAKPSVINHIAPISIAFLVVLFLAQRFGVAKLGLTFAPITLIWLLLLGGTGIYNITRYPGIFRAFDPSRLVLFFVRTKHYDYLAGILLAVTGCEAVFANLGQFNKASIRLGFSCFVYPMLVLAYLGQGARLIADGDAVMSNIFYATIPGPVGGGLYWLSEFSGLSTSLLFSQLSLIASQAMITACFSLIQQLVGLRSLPPLRMIYTSETVQGQVYFPVVNYLLMIGTIVMVAAFKDLANLTNAYGFAVSTVMFVTTSLVAIQAYYTKHLPLVVAVGFFLIFGFFDGLFWGASLRKVPHGAWVPLMIGFVLMVCMVFWTWGKGLEDEFDGMNRKNLRHFIVVDESEDSREKKIRKRLTSTQASSKPGTLTYVAGDTIKSAADGEDADADADAEDGDDTTEGSIKAHRTLYLVPEEETQPRRQLARLPTCAVFHKLTSGRGVPHTFYGFLRQWPSLPRVVIFLSVKTMNINRIPPEERYVVSKVRTLQGFYGVTYALGFRDDFNMDVNEIIERICTLESRVGANDEAAAMANIKEIRAAAKQTTHIVPHYHVVSHGILGFGFLNAPIAWCRALLIEGLYRRFATMFPETENWLGSADEIIRVGINAEI